MYRRRRRGISLAGYHSAASLDHGDLSRCAALSCHPCEGLVLAQVYGEPPNAVATSPKLLTDDEARRIAKLMTGLPQLVEVETTATGSAAVASRSE
jgi:hypothetical protein